MELAFYFDVVCPYAYLASTRVEAIAARTGARLVWRPMLLGGVFRAVGSDQLPATNRSAARLELEDLDLHRQLERAGVPFRFHPDHPRRTVEAMRLLVACDEATRPALARALFEAYWVHNRDVSAPEVVEEIARVHGLDPGVTRRPEVKQALFDATSEAVARGVFAAPAFGVGDRIYWGADRLPLVEQALGGASSAERRARGARGRTVRFFHDFSSPYSYLGSTQIERVVGDAGVQWRPMLLGGLFREIGTPDVPLLAMSDAKRRYLVQDQQDWARWWGVPFRFPSTFPLRTVLPLRVALVEPATTRAIYRAAWVEDRNIGDPSELAEVLTGAGFDGPSLLEATEDPAIKQRLRDNTEEAARLGACGAPSIVTEDDTVIWGQDRMDTVCEMLEG